jgi:hypothetical protein
LVQYHHLTITCGITVYTSEKVVAGYWIVTPLKARMNPTMASTVSRIQHHPFGTRDSGVAVAVRCAPRDRKGGGISRHGTTKVSLLFMFLELYNTADPTTC